MSFATASLRYASLKCTVPFRVILGIEENNIKLSALFEGIVTSKMGIYCPRDPGFIDYSYRPLSSYHPFDLYSERTTENGSYLDSVEYSFVPNFFGSPEEIRDDASFENKLNALVLVGLQPDARKRVSEHFKRLKPSARTSDQDKADAAIWEVLAKRTATRTVDVRALARRLEAIACVEIGAPYVARALLVARQLKELGEEGKAVVARLKAASRANGLNCPGALGLDSADVRVPSTVIP